jgi:hypothetical protein
MGLFDSVYVDCPHCGVKTELQSKAGECCLNRYTLDTAPVEVLVDLMNYEDDCDACGGSFAIVDPDHPLGWRPSLTVIRGMATSVAKED